MYRYVLPVLCALLLAACGVTGVEQDTLQVTVSIVPQAYFVQRIGGEHVVVNVMVEPGASPHAYEPKPEQMRALSRSAAYFSIGVDFEDVWLERIAAANPGMRLVDTTAGIERLPMAAHGHSDAHDEEEDDHDHAGALDPHVWLGPEAVKIQAGHIHAALVALDPQNEAAYTANLAAFWADIETLQGEMRDALSGISNRKFIVFHPAWGYLAHEFNLEQIAIEVGGQEPSAQEMADLVSLAREEGVRVILAQPEFSTRAAETIAREIGGEVLLISPLAPDWLENMRQVAAVLAQALR